MPPVVPYRMVAVWIALEDVSPEAGPLRYAPGSNDIPPFVFSRGHLRVVEDEVLLFNDYMAKNLAERGLGVREFCPKKGDAFIWHPLLYHGGSKILNPAKTRRSLVAHYFPAADYPLGTGTQATSIVMHDAGRYFENRTSIAEPADKSQLSWPGA
jgi:ectoine hydroxylase-related dioxygenase (phytanoyl-CoA dioxygenase family)